MNALITVCLAILAFAQVQASDEITDVTLNLYTRKNPTTVQKLINGNETSLKLSNYDPKKPTVMDVHGWNSPAEDPYFVEVFLNASDVNVILVNWTAYGTGTDEAPVLINARRVGMWLSTVLDWLSDYGPLFKNLHMVGGSIGSHVVGIAARNATKGVVERITVNDPSRKSWEGTDEAVGKKDATYVEVIHSEIQKHGIREPIGDTDFYPNNGILQPGCGNQDLCSHMRARNYFLESIDNEFFKATQCKEFEEILTDSCSNIGELYMGGLKPKYNKTGIYYIKTTGTKPYYIL